MRARWDESKVGREQVGDEGSGGMRARWGMRAE